MRIALNTRFLLDGKMEGFGWYSYEICKRLTELYPQHTFYLFFDRAYDKKFVFSENCIPIILYPQARHPILFKIWFDISVTRALKRYNIDLFFSPDGYLSQISSIPQIGVIHDLNFEHYPNDLPKKHLKYYKKYFPRFAAKARKIITVSEFSRQDIIKTYGIESSKVHAVWNGASEQFQPLAKEECMKIREQYTNGESYFIFVGSIHPRKNVNRLLDAFISFKIESKSRTKLMIVGTPMWDQLPPVPETFKKDIVFTGRLDLMELTKVMASAKALTFVPYFEGFGIPLVEAMKSGTPILTANTTCMPEVAGEAALYVNPFEVESIKAGLLQMDQDVMLRKQLTEKGLERAKLFSWDKAAQEIGKLLEL